jgi:hypothetical protein
MITRSFKALEKFIKPHIVLTYSHTFEDGENIETYTSGTRNMAAIPLTPEILKYLPEGAYNHKDYIFYDLELTALTPLRSVVQRANGKQYRINSVMDRVEDGGYNKYLTKFIEEVLQQ